MAIPIVGRIALSALLLSPAAIAGPYSNPFYNGTKLAALVRPDDISQDVLVQRISFLSGYILSVFDNHVVDVHFGAQQSICAPKGTTEADIITPVLDRLTDINNGSEPKLAASLGTMTVAYILIETFPCGGDSNE